MYCPVLKISSVSNEHYPEDNRNTEIFLIHNIHRKQCDRTETNSNFSWMGMEPDQRNSQTEINEAIPSPTRSIQQEKINKYKNRDNSKKTAKLIGKLNYLRQKFQKASLLLNKMDHQKAQAAILRGQNTSMIMSRTAIPDINQQVAKLRANIQEQLIQIPSQMSLATDAAPSEWGSTREKQLKMIAIAHGSWNKRQPTLTCNNREIKAIIQGLRSFAKILKNSRIRSLAIRSDNNTAVFDIRK
ncbi:MAG: hypothetical protein EZS28_014593 [Streblomastix strix]|uniref:Uncharacterized protein n=1 Tax=Streblomastix strix TaxID=222440 RepID=A0A5J4W5F4_9EUKA|nr:MAG: hypothetical protein EZS28_014593 [Streblomastix strix]